MTGLHEAAGPWGPLAHLLAWTALAVVVVLSVTLLVALRVGKHGVVDVAWGLGFPVVGVAALLASSGHGDPTRRWLVLALTAVWGCRLAVHIGLRGRGQGEDPRYQELLERAPGSRTAYAVRHVYLNQGAVLWFVSLPVQVAMVGAAGLRWLLWVGAAVWLVGFTFEAVGDWQLARFRRHRANTGAVLDSGLWHYTRHPNYFGDATVWWGLWLIAASAWPGLLTVLSPVAMTWLLAKGTGKPLLEKDIAARRPGYAEYVRRTSGFLPLPPKKPQRKADER